MNPRAYLPVQSFPVSFVLDEGPDGGVFRLRGTASLIWISEEDGKHHEWIAVLLDEPYAPMGIDGFQVTTIEVKRDRLKWGV
jgi:hypothetical protein